MIVGQTGTNGLPTFQNTSSSGSGDRELLAALRFLNRAWEQLCTGVPVGLTVPCDVMAAPWRGALQTTQGAPPQWQRRDSMQAPANVQALPVWEASSEPFRSGSFRAVVAELLALLPADTLWFGDAGQTRHAMGIELGRKGIRVFQSSSARPVCCFTGDGRALRLANEWTTAVKLHLPITFVLAESGVLGGPFDRPRDTGAEHLGRLPALNWCALADALGLSAQCVDATLSLSEALAALPASGPRLLVVPLPERDSAVRARYELLQSEDR